MKVQPGYTRSYTEVSNSNNNNQRRTNPSFGNAAAPLVSLATFIENNGFLGEFLTIDTFGMMGPRTIQGYTRNSKELGHPNYKAGREELVRELLSGPAYFFVPLGIISLAGILRGKCAKVNNFVLDSFKPIMKKLSTGLKDSKAVKNDFIDKLTAEAFKDYKNETPLIEKITDLLKKSANKEISVKKAAKEAQEHLTILNKANGKFLDNTSNIQIGEKPFNISSIFSDVSNYLDHFTSKAAKTSEPTETFIEKFHKKAKDLRNATNIMAVAALSAFLLIIPKLYQTDKKFPGKDGLVGADNADTTNGATDGKEAANVSK